ncbi:MAG: hypothetical protein JNN25_17805 [Candidatus Kapabacteria bacterium]|nr:hypothetical protein [Candidatus Kapabacteria bacterium]
MDIPNTFKVGYSFNIRNDTSKSISALGWDEFLGYEKISSSFTQGVPSVYISSAYAQILSVRFDRIPLSFETPATIESFTLIVDKYTPTPPKRISGRISFRMVSGDNPGQFVEVRDGRFENVRFEYQN